MNIAVDGERSSFFNEKRQQQQSGPEEVNSNNVVHRLSFFRTLSDTRRERIEVAD